MRFPGFATHGARISQGRAAPPIATTAKTSPSEKKLKRCGDLARIVVTGIGVHKAEGSVPELPELLDSMKFPEEDHTELLTVLGWSSRMEDNSMYRHWGTVLLTLAALM